jgi:hypothetical protein
MFVDSSGHPTRQHPVVSLMIATFCDIFFVQIRDDMQGTCLHSEAFREVDKQSLILDVFY